MPHVTRGDAAGVVDAGGRRAPRGRSRGVSNADMDSLRRGFAALHFAAVNARQAQARAAPVALASPLACAGALRRQRRPSAKATDAAGSLRQRSLNLGRPGRVLIRGRALASSAPDGGGAAQGASMCPLSPPVLAGTSTGTATSVVVRAAPPAMSDAGPSRAAFEHVQALADANIEVAWRHVLRILRGSVPVSLRPLFSPAPCFP